MSIRVLLADDAEIVRKAIRKLLKGNPEISIVGEADNIAETLKLTSDRKPQVILMDLHMSDGKNVTLLRVKSRFDTSGSLVLAMSIWNDSRTKALAHSIGAVTLLDKTKLRTDLIPAIKQCANGFLAQQIVSGEVGL